MPRRRAASSLFFDTMKLAFDAQAVVAMRAFEMASGRTSAREGALMVSEKIEAMFRAQAAAASAILSGHSDAAFPAAVSVYGRSARANRVRLTRAARAAS